MEHNTVYNLMNQMTQELKSLWRIKNVYSAEATDETQKAFWLKLAEQKEQTINELKSLIKSTM